METTQYIYSVEDISKKLNIKIHSIRRMILKSGVNGIYIPLRKKRMFSETDIEKIKLHHKVYYQELKPEVIYVKETYHIYESKLNSMP